MAQFLRAPYQPDMDLGMGFNSYTQSTCLGKAVTIKRSVSVDKTQIPQRTLYFHDTVEKLSNITSKLDISGTIAIKAGVISGSGTGSFVDESVFAESDLNFLIQVTVENEHPATDSPDEQFNLLANVTPGNFSSIYGDTYIYDFQEGGVFQAVVSMKILDETSKHDINVAAQVAFAGVEGGVDASGQVESAKEILNKSTSMTVKAFWNGGGQVKKPEVPWTVDELINVGSRFPVLCAQTPARTYAVLKRYVFLASFLAQAKQISPLSYDEANLVTNTMLDDFLRYKTLFTRLVNLIEGILDKTIEFDPDAPAPEAEDPFKPSLTAKNGLLDAKRDLLAQTAAINNLVDEITADPSVVNTLTPDKPPRYMDPVRWELRLPATRPAVAPPKPTVLDPKIVLRGKPAVTVLPSGQHEVFAQGADGFLWRKLTTPGAVPAPQDVEVWEFHGNAVSLDAKSSPVSVTATLGPQPDQLRKYCFILANDSRLYFKTADGPSGAWSPLRPLEAAREVLFEGGLAACARGARVDLVGVGVDGSVYWTTTTPTKADGTKATAKAAADGPASRTKAFPDGPASRTKAAPDGPSSAVPTVTDAWPFPAPLPGPPVHGTPTLVPNPGDGNSLNLIAVNREAHLQVNILPSGAPAPPNPSSWSGWKVLGSPLSHTASPSAAWPAHPEPDWRTQLDVMFVDGGGENNNVWEAQLLHGAWRDGGSSDFNKSFCEGPVAVLSASAEHEEFFVVAEGGSLWNSTYDRARGIDARVWRKVGDGAFRPEMPVVVPIGGGGDMAVYVVGSDDGRLMRFVESGGKFGPAERV